ncbi:RagB/SusD family nutrient uptake outer membrane protein [Parabacteroides sp. AM08-6]|uniref:RagB/SusD family nutrient uptake outer membrane protein n=1 Tax=Parabacteroides sp. AM08-6 TaxID=2292053 RepID=UPI000F00A2DA|nr:RagB/SusD family nutrient uptake outer membrane protein [Parabacteroides sp. AM08-6]RHJ85410.1 RagB/SusD family nutrient uptake outer membrane protein [Parabacteroides sp. AM08-6]
MKRIIYMLSAVGLLTLGACNDQLDTNPTDRVSGTIIFSDANGAEVAMNGIYRATYVAGWGTGWADENPGFTGIYLAGDLMGEDHLMLSQGQGWFYEDYRLNVRQDYTHKQGRPYQFWNIHYTLISNTNYIIAQAPGASGDKNLLNSVLGQAYAMRAYCYFQLIQLYQQTYKGNESAPGVPLYTEPTTSASVGKARGTVEDVYAQIDSDLKEAISLLKDCGIAQKHASHIDYYVANGIKARVCLVQGRYEEAAAAAKEALTKPGLTPVETVASLGGFNSSKLSNVLWGVEVIADQSQHFASFFSHMDADAPGMYAEKAPQCISSWLYNNIPATDDRKAWWRGELEDEVTGTSMQSYCQIKFKFANVTNRTGDYIYMRGEEMLLILAEAECHLKHYTEARKYISELGGKRDKDYATRLAKYSDSDSYNQNTIAPLQTLMDEILFQRRVELWGEQGRIFDLQRLKLGYNRDYEGSNHTELVKNKDTNAGSKEFIMTLPQSEIDGNENISASDQNPF